MATNLTSAIGDHQHITVDGCDTIASLFRHRCQHRADKTAHREKHYGIWRSYSWDDYYNGASHIGLGLLSLGLQPNDVVSILSEDNREWLCCDMGITIAGGIPSGVYTTDSASQLAYIINDSGSRFLFVENDEQLDKYLEVQHDLPSLLKVIVFDREGLRDFKHQQVIFLDALIKLGAEYQKNNPDTIDNQINSLKPEDTALLIYTSGTTGPPKGAMISHRNVIYQLTVCDLLLDIRDTDEQLCFLPLCHIYERVLSSHLPLATGATVNFTESVETIFDNMREVSPHTFSAVPRFWEKMYSQVQIRRSEATGIGRWALDKAVNSGLQKMQKPDSDFNRLRYKFWDILVLSNLRNMIGMNRMRRGGSGAAPVSAELLDWFNAIGVPVLEGYGATETTGVASVNTFEDNTPGSVGKPLPGTQVAIADNGEIMVKGPHVFKGYWNKPDKTAESLSADGWLHTGDIGRLDNNGALTITGRIKDIIITAGGKNITPAEIESQLKFSPYISDAIVVGDKRKYLTCLIMIDQENVENYAQEHRVPFSDFASLCAAKQVVDVIEKEVKQVNQKIARVEQIKDFRLINVLLTAEDEELTPTMKLKRGLVEERHAPLIEAMYG